MTATKTADGKYRTEIGQDFTMVSAITGSIYRFQASRTSNARAAGISDLIVLVDDLFTGPLSVSPGSGPAGTEPRVRACRAEPGLRPDTDMSRPGCCLQRLPGLS